MFDLGDEFTLQSYRIPWLIWIQLIVLFLLLLLLFCFTLFPLDLADDSAAASATASTSMNGSLFHDFQQIQNEKPLAAKQDSAAIVVTSRRRHTQGRENSSIITREMATCASLRREVAEGEPSSLFVHLCHYFQLARVAFLKCFGLDSNSDGPSTRSKHRKRKQS